MSTRSIEESLNKLLYVSFDSVSLDNALTACHFAHYRRQANHLLIPAKVR